MQQAMATGESLDSLYRETVSTRFEVHIPKPELEIEDETDLLERLERSVALAQERKREEP
jgi:hypothetical protein